MRDARHVERDGVQSAAALSSGQGNNQAIILYGPNKESFNEVFAGAKEAVLESNVDVGRMFVASGSPEIAFYADGQLTATILNPSGPEVSDAVKAQLEDDFNQIIAPRKH